MHFYITTPHNASNVSNRVWTAHGLISLSVIFHSISDLLVSLCGINCGKSEIYFPINTEEGGRARVWLSAGGQVAKLLGAVRRRSAKGSLARDMRQAPEALLP